MTDREAWVRFYAALAQKDPHDVRRWPSTYADVADAMLEEYKKRYAQLGLCRQTSFDLQPRDTSLVD